MKYGLFPLSVYDILVRYGTNQAKLFHIKLRYKLFCLICFLHWLVTFCPKLISIIHWQMFDKHPQNSQQDHLKLMFVIVHCMVVVNIIVTVHSRGCDNIWQDPFLYTQLCITNTHTLTYKATALFHMS